MLPNQNQNLLGGFLLTTLLLPDWGAEPALALKGQPKLGPEAAPITQQTASVRTAPATDDRTLSPFYLPPGSPDLAARWKILLGQERRV